MYSPWNFLYEMVGLNPPKRYHNDIGIFSSYFEGFGPTIM